MSNRSANGVVVVTIGLIFILLLVVGGVGFYILIERQRMGLAVKKARAVEAQAREQAEIAHFEAARAVAARKSAGDDESSAGLGD